MEFKDAIKLLRGELSITQGELANALRINVSTVSRWELGQTLPNRSITSVLMDYAAQRSASGKCLGALRQSAADAARHKLSFRQEELAPEETLKERSERQMRDIVDNISGGVSVAVLGDNGEAALAYANEGYYQLFGYTREQFLTELKTPHDLLHPEDAPAVADAVRRVKEQREAITFKYRAYKRDGSIIHIRCSSSVAPIEGLGEAVMMSILTDISTLAEAEELMQARQSQMAELMNTTPGGIAVLEVDSEDIAGTLHTTYYNDHFFSYSGYSREEYDALLKGDEFHLIFEQDREPLLELTKALCVGEMGVSKGCSVRCHTKDGGYRWLLLTGQLVERHGTACVINIVLVDITAAREAQDRQRISEEMLRIAAESDNRAMILFDIKAHSCRVESRTLFSASYGEVIENVPQSLLNMGIAEPGSAAELEGLFGRLCAGEERICTSLQLHTGENRYSWFECNATVLFDADGQPDHAVLVLHDITEQRIKEAVFKKWQQSINTRPAESFTLFRSNLSRDSGIDEQDGALLRVSYGSEIRSFNDRTREYAENYVFSEDRAAYYALMDSDVLLAMYYRGEHSASLEYREIAEDGQLHWRLLTVEMVEYLSSTDVQVFLMYEDIDEKKTAELRQKEFAETDPLTGALNRVTFSTRVNEILQSESGTQHALLMMDLDGFKLMNDIFGHAAGDQALMDITAILRSLIREDDLLCRLGGDEFIVLLRDISYDAVIEKKAQQMCEQVRKAYSLDVQISASMGVSVFPRDGRNFDELYRKADKALYRVKQQGKNSYSFFSFDGDGGKGEGSGRVLEPPVVTKTKRRMLVADDCAASRALLSSIFAEDFIIETAKTGTEAMIRLRHFGSAVSVVLLDLTMPGLDGFEVLKRMQSSVELRTIPVIVVSADEDYETIMKAVKCGAAEYVTKPVDPRLTRLRVQSAISKSENERLRAQNSYLQLQRDEELKYHTVLESTGTVVIEYNWRNHVFMYDRTISRYIAGDYSTRGLWQVFLSDMVAESADVKALQDMMLSLANDATKNTCSRLVMLKTPERIKHWFRMNVYKQTDEFGLAAKMIITFNDVHDEVLKNERLMFQATRDDVTLLYNRRGFMDKAQELIAAGEPGHYVMTSVDIERFKVINDQYGPEKGDEVLRQFGQALSRLENEGGAVCGRIMADNFAVLRPKDIDQNLLREVHQQAEILDRTLPPIKFYVGTCGVDDKSLSASAIYDRATMAKNTVKGRYDTYIAVYDESMRTGLLRQQRITSQMKRALESGQFEVWLQPQYNHATGTLFGAEALVRWRHPVKGVIPPAEFIPVFERNGFVYEIDKFVWESCCSLLRCWLDEGLSPVPLSVNISRYDLFRADLIEVLDSLLRRYDLTAELLRLEITETAFAESSDQIIQVVRTLVDKGYIVEIDDFGSGYSSLNTLKDVPAQVIKLDMRFLENDSNSQRGGSIIESVVRMSKWLGMSIIAEGVESVEQADYLKSIGCEHMQGYLYSKPVPVDEYESLFKNGKTNPALSTLRALDTWNNNAFWDPKSIESLIFNSYVGAACIFEFHNGQAELLRVNDRYSEEFGIDTCDGKPFAELSPVDYLDEENLRIMFGNIQTAIGTNKESTCELNWHYRKDGTQHIIYVRSTARVIASAGERHLLYCVVTNITNQRLAERKEHSLSERIQAIMSHTDSGIAAIAMKGHGQVEPVFLNKRYYDLLGYTPEQYEREVQGPMDLIVPEDYEKLLPEIKKIPLMGQTRNFDMRVKRRDGRIIWLRTAVSVISFSDIPYPVQLSCFTDMTELKKRDDKLKYLNATMLQLMNNTPGAFVQMKVSPTGVISAEYCNDSYFELVGMNRRETRAVFKKDVLGGVHPDDVELVKEAVGKMLSEGEAHNVRCRLRHKTRGYIWVMVSGQTMRGKDGEILLNAYYTDATEQVNAEDKQKELLDNLPYGAGLYEYDGKRLSVVHLNKRYWELVGRPVENMGASFINSVHPEDRPGLLQKVESAIHDGQDPTVDLRVLTGDGSYRSFHIVGRVVRHDDGRFAIYTAHTPL